MAMDEDRTRKKKEEDEEEEEEEQTNTKGKGIIEKKKGIVIQNYENSPFLLLLCYFLKFPKYPCLLSKSNQLDKIELSTMF